jgi:acyl-CoA thioesterase I
MIAAALAVLPLGARTAASATACPPAVAAAFADNGAQALLASRAGAARPLQILAIGSSSTLGVGASSPGHAYPAQLAVDLSTQWGIPAEVRNAGVGGEVSEATLARLKAEIASDRPDLVVWQVGTNDAVAGVDIAEFQASLEAGIAQARLAQVPIILVDPQFYFGIKNLARFEQFVTTVGEVGAKAHVPVFSRFAMMRAWAARSAAQLNAAMSADGFHMSDHGYACFASDLADDIARESGRVGKSAAAKM